ncbi:hypothetical protein [Bradyrhizobium genosp. P]|uniref:hypothetical protein n=1 Tax=Bradyrhizobium genosp. P TaxID=83641 RepID=UPI003CF37191
MGEEDVVLRITPNGLRAGAGLNPALSFKGNLEQCPHLTRNDFAPDDIKRRCDSIAVAQEQHQELIDAAFAKMVAAPATTAAALQAKAALLTEWQDDDVERQFADEDRRTIELARAVFKDTAQLRSRSTSRPPVRAGRL